MIEMATMAEEDGFSRELRRSQLVSAAEMEGERKVMAKIEELEKNQIHYK